jgi:DNA-binding transcriptional regulator YiaG
MTNLAAVLKSEIARVARKEVRSETAALKKASSAHRAEIAALKRRLQAAELLLRKLGKAMPKEKAASDAPKAPKTALRFRVAGFAALRKKLGLSATDCGLLLGASAQSVYNWEQGNARPRPAQLAAISALGSMGKQAAAARLEELKAV